MRNSSGVSTQLVVGVVILVAGGAFLGIEYFLMKWYPRHQLRVSQETLKLLPYQNDGIGVQMQVAAGLYGKVESFPNGIRVYRSRLWGAEPSLSITSQPNPDHAAEFSPQVLAIWETDGVTKGIRRYHFERTNIENRDSVLIWQPKDHIMNLTTRIITPDRIVVADCSVGGDDEALFMQACDESVRTMKIAGPEAPPKMPTGGVEEIPGVLR